tara:strand:+ start:209 stop:352 length:144 start_codon:yes stop_codon:yes gene_type:complete
MRRSKNDVHQNLVHPRRVETTDEDILSGVVVMIVLGTILGVLMGLAI